MIILDSKAVSIAQCPSGSTSDRERNDNTGDAPSSFKKFWHQPQSPSS